MLDRTIDRAARRGEPDARRARAVPGDADDRSDRRTATRIVRRLRAEAERQGKPPEGVAREWLTERLVLPAPADARERSIAAMRAAGLLVEPSPATVARAAQATMTLEEVSDALDRAGGKPLSEIILEQRGPKE